jgi:uncharacterized protein
MTLDTLPPTDSHPKEDNSRLWQILVAAAVLWAIAYLGNRPLWDAVVYDLAGLEESTRLGNAVHFFFYDTVKILLLVSGMIFVIGLFRASVSPERIRSILTGRRALTGYLLAAAFGAITPFCSCSSVPLFIGMVAAGVPLGVTFTFLIASPLVNEVGVVMLAGMFDWQIPALYVTAAMAMAVAAGLVLSRLRLERWVEPFVFNTPVGQLNAGDTRPTLRERVDAAWAETADITRKVLPYVLVGIALGAGIHGWVPEDFFGRYAGADNIWAVPVAAIAGIPLYANVASVIPLVEALAAKGMSLGALMAFMMSIVALSAPSLILLRRVLKLRLLVIFTAIVTVGILAIGYLFNLIT